MLVWLFEYLTQFYTGFHVFQYITLRTILAVITALLLALLFGPAVIRYLTKLKVGQTVRNDGPQSHLAKSGTPTMGGVLILLAILLSTLLWARLNNHYVWTSMFVLLSFGAIGWIDDYKKIVYKDPNGLKSRWKFFWQSVFAMVAVVFLYVMSATPVETQLIVPFFKEVAIELGIFYVILGYFVVVGSSNAVNLTDGLDGLAILPTVLVAGALGVFAYLTGHLSFAGYLVIPHIAGVGEVTIIAGAVVGAGLGFLWYNSYPAQVFMGDVGALALGALLGIMAIIVRQELALFMMGGLFVIETLSVILQVLSFRLTGKRIFKMAPLHHHFELAGWPEPKVIVRFWILTVIFVLCGLATLKIR